MNRMPEITSSNKPHRNLLAWQKTMEFAVDVYQLTRNFPQEELYALTSQLRRAAVSAPSNIAEGAAGRTRQQFSNFLSNAIGSLNEIDTQLELALRLGYLTGTDYDRLYQALDECIALTYGLRKAIISGKTQGSKQNGVTRNPRLT
jgi:four helix bundle protein